MIRLLFLSCTILFTFQLHAQRIGVKAGLALATYNAIGRQHPDPYYSKSIINTTLKPGIIVGGYADFELNKNLFLRPGTEIVVKGSVEEAEYTNNGSNLLLRSTYNFSAVDFPIQIVYKKDQNKNRQLLLGAGIIPGILIEGGLNKGDLGAGLLAGYQFPSGINFTLTYNHGLLNVATHSYDYLKLKNRYLGLTMGYQFHSATTNSNQTIEPETKEIPSLNSPAKAVFAEIGGSGGFLSLNYDTRLKNSNKGWGLRVGAGMVTDLNSNGFTFPFAINYLSGERAHFFEMALGATYFSFSERSQDSWFSFTNLKFVAPNAWIGYRYQPEEKHFFFRAGVNQFFAGGINGFLAYPFPGLSFGYSIH